MAAKKTEKKAAATKSAEETSATCGPQKKVTVTKNAKATPKPEKKPAPSIDSIARSAYLNYRRRVENGLPGDSHGDWLEAERQLREEG
jgi:hypothetical protein